MAAPVPGLSVTVCSEVTGLAVGAAGALGGGASGLPEHAVQSAMQTSRPIFVKFMDAMRGIIMDFGEGARSGDAAQQRSAHRTGSRAAGHREADFLTPAHGEQSQCADGIV
jgi:hypothetical protein